MKEISHLLEFYGKHFWISNFGQPGQVETAEVHHCQIRSAKAKTDHTQCGTTVNTDFNHQYIQAKTKIKQG